MTPGELVPPKSSTPLAGYTVLVTRAPHQAAALVGPLEALGAEVLVAPMIDTVDPADWAPADAALRTLASYDWLVLTSTNAVDRLLARLDHLGVSRAAFDGVRIAVVGAATAERLAEHGLTPDVVPADFRAEGLIEEFEALGVVAPGTRFLLPRAERAREILPEALRDRGATVDVAVVYRTVPTTPDPAIVERLRSGGIDVITFTSPSTVRHFVSWLSSAGLDPESVLATAAAASIGPVTSEALRSRGHEVAIEAPESTMGGLVRAIVVAVFGRSEHG